MGRNKRKTENNLGKKRVNSWKFKEKGKFYRKIRINWTNLNSLKKRKKYKKTRRFLFEIKTYINEGKDWLKRREKFANETRKFLKRFGKFKAIRRTTLEKFGEFEKRSKISEKKPKTNRFGRKRKRQVRDKIFERKRKY